MSGVSTEQVTQLNNRVKSLNSERQRLLGARESAQAEFDRLRLAYQTKYGVDVTPETLQAEYNKVFAEVQGAYMDVSEKVQSIENGDYKTVSAVPTFNPSPDVEPIRAEKVVAPPAQPTPPAPAPTLNPNALAEALTMQATPVKPPEEMKEFLQHVQTPPTSEPAPIEPPPEVQAMSDSAVADKLNLFGGMMQPTQTPATPAQPIQAPPTWGSVDTSKPLDQTFEDILKP